MTRTSTRKRPRHEEPHMSDPNPTSSPQGTTARTGSDAGQAPPATMPAVVARRYGGPEQLAIEQIDTPRPGPHDLLVAVAASSTNALDWHFLTGTPYVMRMMSGLRRPKRIVHGADIAGTVVATGSAVTRFEVGDDVFGEGAGGGFAPYATIAGSNVAAIPDGVSFDAAGATPVAGLTAVQALRTHGAVRKGDHVLVNGAAGGVGTFAVQIAVALDAEVTAVCSSRNVDMVRRLGADHVIDYERDDFVQGGPRFDVMVDVVGNRTPAECLSVLHPDARYVLVGGPKTNRLLGPLTNIVRTGVAFRRAAPSFHQFTAAPNVDDLQFLGELLADGRVVPEIDRVVGLDGVPDAMAEIGTGHARSKIVVAPST